MHACMYVRMCEHAWKTREWSRDFLRTAFCCTLPSPVALASASASATMAFSDASQLGGTFDASQLEGSSPKRHVIQLRIGSFTVGINQGMLDGKRCRKNLRKVEYIITTCVQDWGLDIMNLSEFGGHRQGLHACRPPIHADDMEIFQKEKNLSTPSRQSHQQLPHSIGVRRRYYSVWRPSSDGRCRDPLSKL